MDEMRKIRTKKHSIKRMKRHDLLQLRIEKCNRILYGEIQPFNQE